MPPCGRCGADVAYVYDPDEQLLTIDAQRVDDGNVELEGKVGAHLVAPGAGRYRVHECEGDARALARPDASTEPISDLTGGAR